MKSTVTYIYNWSFSSGTVPNKLKIAQVIPIYKKGSTIDLSNYRPISLLSIFSKLLEILMYTRLINFFEKNDVLFHGQFGFRANHSTSQALILITDKIQKAIEEKLFSCGVFLDLRKAFVTVDHSILINKLQHYGIRGIANKWFNSYLDDRKQIVSVGTIKSDLNDIVCGVPQGSVLRPLLFLVYINDFNNSSDLLDFHLFADDSNLFYAHKNLRSLEEHLNQQLINIHNWLCANKLSFNVDKSHFVIFHPVQKVVDYTINLSINNKDLVEKKSYKYLGVIIDSNLNWKEHVNELCKKISRGIGILLKLRNFVKIDILIKIYYSIIYPFLIYGIIIWGNTYKTNVKPLTELQKKAIRIITFSPFRTHSSPLFKELNLLKFPDIVQFCTVLFMHQYHCDTLPIIFTDFFKEHKHNYNTRLSSKSTFALPKVRTNYGIFNIRYCGPKAWNSVDESLKLLSNKAFKRQFKISLISLY